MYPIPNRNAKGKGGNAVFINASINNLASHTFPISSLTSKFSRMYVCAVEVRACVTNQESEKLHTRHEREREKMNHEKNE